MNFVQPLYLLGILAAGLPILVHLINRRQAAEQPFPALEMLMESDKKEARSIKVRRWVLMALRVLAVLLLVFALAKPYVYSESSVGGAERVPKSVVYVLDDSFSMQHGDWWSRGTERLERELGALKPWDKAALLTTTRDEGPVARLVKKHGQIRRALGDLSASQRKGRLHETLLRASDLLSQSDRHREIVVVGDFTRGGIETISETDETIPYPVRRISVRDDDEHPGNLAVTDVSYRQKSGANERAWTITASIRNYGSESFEDVEMQFQIGGHVVATELVDVPAGQSISQSITHQVEGDGVRRGRVRLLEADSLELDNERHFTFQLRKNVDVLMVNGSPSSVPYRDELFFTVRALNPGDGSESEIVPTTVTPSALTERDLSDFDVVLMANVAQPSEEATEALTSFVEGGGGLFVAMGDQVETKSYNKRLDSLLPKPLRRIKRLAQKDDPDAPLKVTRIGSSKGTHPVFQVFNLPGGASLQSVKVYKYMLLQPSPPERSTALLSYKNGAPALLERQVGKGRVFMLTTTLDRDWTDLPVQPAFLPLMRRSILYLARRATSEGEERHHVGTSVELDVSGLIEERAIIKDPEGTRIVLEPRNGTVAFTPERAGSYEVWVDTTDDAERNRLGGLAFSVNVDTDESNLRPLDKGALDPWMTDSEDAAGDSATGGEAEGTPEKRVNLWPALLFGVTLALLFETIVGTRRSVLKRLWRRATFQSEPEIDV